MLINANKVDVYIVLQRHKRGNCLLFIVLNDETIVTNNNNVAAWYYGGINHDKNYVGDIKSEAIGHYYELIVSSKR